MNIRKLVCIFFIALSLAACGDGGNKGTPTPSLGTGYPAPQQPLSTSTPAAYTAP